MQERKIDIDAADAVLHIVEEWGRRPEIKERLAQALASADNSLMALVLTGIQAGLFSNNPNSNQVVLDKLRIAFNLGYYARSMAER